jgi:hypothetical protein
MVYYQQQNVALLAQISTQVASLVPQVSIPSTLPPPFPDFSPRPSDVRVNAFWFMSLVFSLAAALLATLVQQWVRDYMHVFQRYSNPLKGARLRQYLYEGVEGWYMPRVARSVPGLVHISLFLFFAGLVDSLLATYTTVGVTTTIPIAICSSLYIFSMFAPAINPQCPFRKPLLWPNVVSEAEDAPTALLRSRIWWIDQGCEFEPFRRTDSTGDGGERRTEISRRSGSPMAHS